MTMKMVTKFKVCTPKPDADLCMRVDLPPDKKIVENQDLAGGRGPPGLRAAEPLGRRGPWAADLLFAKPVLECCNFLS